MGEPNGRSTEFDTPLAGKRGLDLSSSSTPSPSQVQDSKRVKQFGKMFTMSDSDTAGPTGLAAIIDEKNVVDLNTEITTAFSMTQDGQVENSQSHSSRIQDIHDRHKQELEKAYSKADAGEKLDLLINEIISFEPMKTSIRNIENKLDRSLSNEACLVAKVEYLETQNIALTQRMKKLERRMEDSETRQMRENILIYNVNEDKTKYENTKDIAMQFFIKELKIQGSDKDKIDIDDAHRNGPPVQPGKDFKRPIVVKMASRTAKKFIMERVQELKGSNYSLSDQLPKATQERRSAQVKDLKQFKQQGQKAKLVRDVLIVNKTKVDPQFEKRPLIPRTGIFFETALANLKISNEMKEKGSLFQAFSLNVGSDDEIQSGLAAVRKMHPYATHQVYAYKYDDTATDKEITGHCDDGEWGASRYIASQLDQGAKNKLIVVVRYFGGQNLGKQRFDIYSSAAKAAAT